MKTTNLWNPPASIPRKFSSLCLAAALIAPALAGTLTQNFEQGEDTTNWGASWSNLSQVETNFLATGFGGIQAGGGKSKSSQEYSRDFRNNTAGVDITTGYSISMYVIVGTFDDPNNGEFEIVDGKRTGGHTANLRVRNTGGSGLSWEAYDEVTGWVDLGIELSLLSPYLVELVIDPVASQYSAAVHQVDGDGNVLATGSMTGMDYIPSADNGQLLFYTQGASGEVGFLVDNISISAVPEPASAILTILGAGGFLCARRRRA